MSQTVIGIFDTQAHAKTAVQQLKTNGYNEAAIDLSTGGQTAVQYGTAEYKEEQDNTRGFFSSLFDSDDDVDAYSSIAGHGTIVTVHTHDMAEAKRAASILDQYGAINAEDRVNKYRAGQYCAADYQQAAAATSNDGVIEVVEENLEVGKQVVQTGAVEVRSHIVERPVEETVRLRKEHVWVERTPVNRPASAADLTEEVVKVEEHAEMAVVNKEARVVEEIEVKKEVEQEQEVIRDTVRHTEIEVNEKAPVMDKTVLKNDLNKKC